MTLDSIDRYDAAAVSPSGDRAIVVGGSVAGLLAARVLADAYEEVVVLERDVLPDEPTARGGVPQASQIHVLQDAGRVTVEDLCPGYAETLLSAGGVLFDGASDLRFYDQGGFLADGPRRMPVFSATRPLFEYALREHVTARANVTIRDETRVTDYALDDAGSTVDGVVVREGAGDAQREPADLVVDAMGRASRTPAWLDEHGYAAPPEASVSVDVGYATTVVDRPADDRTATMAAASAPRTRGEAVFPIEGDRSLVNVHGVDGNYPSSDVDGMRAFADALPTNAVATALDERSVVGDVDAYRYPSSRRRYYERLDAFPDGLLVIGDAIASFNPIYGQGMSVAAFEALALHHALAADGTHDLPARFFDRAADVVDDAWTFAFGADAAFAFTDVELSPEVDAFTWYFERALRVAQDDGEIRDRVFRVISMQASPKTLLRPGVARRVLAPSSDDLPQGVARATGRFADAARTFASRSQ